MGRVVSNRGRILLAALAAVWVVWRVGAVLADNGAFRDAGNKHANTTTGPYRDLNYPRGSCAQCHTQHNAGGASQDFALFAVNDNALCYTCHAAAYQRAWPGSIAYDGSGHGASIALYVPATGRQVKLCVQCHNPHGNRDATYGLYPSLLKYLEEGGATGYTAGGCYSNSTTTGQGCHGSLAGNRPTGALDIYTQFAKLVKHPLSTATTPRHTSTETQTAGWNPSVNRHVECVDCHNPHRAKLTVHTPPTNVLSGSLLGTWGVEPTFGAAWTQPTAFTVKSFTNDPPLATDKEYQVCLKCHSYFSWTTAPPANYTCQAKEFNAANPSYHMVVAAAKSAGMFATAGMVTIPYVWTTSSNMYCSDCHSQETITSTLASPRGAHGSANTRLLWGAWNGTTGALATDTHLCFKCHPSNNYIQGGTGARTTTGFSDASRNLHTFHMGMNVRCFNCHVKVPHGWKWPHMIAQRADQAANPLYYGSSAGIPNVWVNTTTWNASGAWNQASCDHTG